MSVSITLNDKLVEVPGNKMTVTYEELVELAGMTGRAYEELVEMAGMTGIPTLTVSHRNKSIAEFTLTPRQSCS